MDKNKLDSPEISVESGIHEVFPGKYIEFRTIEFIIIHSWFFYCRVRSPYFTVLFTARYFTVLSGIHEICLAAWVALLFEAVR